MNLLKKFGIMTCLSLGLCGFLTPAAQAANDKPLDLNNFDTSIKPGDDFFRYSNGAWMKSNPIPPEYFRWGSFNLLDNQCKDQLKSIFEDIKNQKTRTAEGQKIYDYYTVSMDTVRLNKEGVKPLMPYLQSIDKMKSTTELTHMLATMHRQGPGPLFGPYVSQDDKNSTMNIMCLFQGGLGLGNRDYYTDNTDRAKELRNQYVKHIENMFDIIYKGKNNKQVAESIMNLETELANISITRVEQRDPQKTYNPMTLTELQATCPGIDWNLYFETCGVKNPGKINVTSMKFFKGLSDIIKKTPLDTWKNYLKWNYISAFATNLNSDLDKENFAFFGKIFSGTQEQQPRWKRSINATDGALGMAIGKLYCDKYFPASSKQRMLELVSNLRAAFAARIQNLTWMSDATKKIAEDKLSAINVKVGYPDKWKDYSKLSISGTNSYLQNVINSDMFEFDDNMAKCNKPVDKTEWGMTPQTVNAYYSPNMNEIVFPAGILQPPFFFANGDDAMNYGGIGGVIGHEMTHGFDDQGCQYDKNGNLNNWWN